MGTPVEELVTRAAGLARGDDLPAALAGLASASTRDIDAAFSLARRRRSADPSAAAATDLLEASALARRRGALAPAGWWAPGSVALSAFLVGQGGLTAVNVHRWVGWTGVAVTVAAVAVLTIVIVWLLRRHGERWAKDHLAPDGTGRAAEIASRLVEVLGEEVPGDAAGDDARRHEAAAAAVRSRGVADPVLVLGAIRRAELVAAGWPEGRRERAREITSALRERTIEGRLDGAGPDALRRLAHRGRR